MKEKEKTENIYIGIDVSKKTLDYCIYINQVKSSGQLENQVKAIKAFIGKLAKQHPNTHIHICMESTGYYNWPLYQVCNEFELKLYVVNPLHLKRSMGMVRGKSDSIDAERIVKFLMVNNSRLSVFIIPRLAVLQLQTLVAQRKRLIEAKVKLQVPVNELKSLGDKTLGKVLEKYNKETINALKKQIIAIEQKINNLIVNDELLSEQFTHITSVQGVGKVLAWCMIIKTNEFKSINNPRKLACYAGVVPFDHQSGTSINKKPRVSIMADKTTKKLLHMAAMRAIQLKGDLQTYFIRKVNEGKNKMSVLNAVRNKIVARICSVVNNKKNYIINLQMS